MYTQLHARSWSVSVVIYLGLFIAIFVFHSRTSTIIPKLRIPDESTAIIRTCLFMFSRIIVMNIFISIIFFILGKYKQITTTLLFVLWNAFFIFTTFSKNLIAISSLSFVIQLTYCVYSFIEILAYSYSYFCGIYQQRLLWTKLVIGLLIFAGGIEALLPWIFANVEGS